MILLTLLSFGLVPNDRKKTQKTLFSYILFAILFALIYIVEVFVILLLIFYSWEVFYQTSVPISITDVLKYPSFFYVIFMTALSLSKYQLKGKSILLRLKELGRNRNLLITFIILVVSLTILGVRNIAIKKKLATPTKTRNTRIKYRVDDENEKKIRDKYKQLEDLQNNEDFEAIYSMFFSPTYIKKQNAYYSPYRNDETDIQYFHNYYIDIITKYRTGAKGQNIHFKINQVRFINNNAFVDRVLTMCFDADCTNVSTQLATVKWIEENGKWYTSQEVPLCVKNGTFKNSSSVPDQNNFVIDGTSIQIVTVPECDMFPISWMFESEINAEELSQNKISKDIQLAKKALNKYPSKLLSKFLSRVYILNNLFTDRILRGGMNSNDIIAIIDEGIEKDYSESFIENSIHHELAHILIEKYEPSFDKDTGNINIKNWIEINPSNFVYEKDKSSNLDDVFKETSMDLSSDLSKSGFLTKYSTYDMKEDFVIISSWLFMGSADFWTIVDNNENIAAKVKIAIAFYNGIDMSFTEEFFRSIK